MCGFSGVYFKEKNIKVDIILKESLEKISHRGNKIYYGNDSNFFYGYLRLPTDSLDFEDKNYLKKILYNGIIYNTDFLIKNFSLNLEKNFDSLVLKEAYDKFGIKLLENLRGMFAFSFNKKDSIELIRDSIGIKPLYYTIGKNIFAFSSEIKGLVDICKKYKTRVVEVLPGEIIIFDKKKFSIEKKKFYYKSYTNYNKENFIEKILKDSLIDPAKKYLKSNKKIAVLLSGGLDSSIITYSLIKNNIEKNKILFFSMGLKGSSDRKAVEKIEKDLKIKVNYIEPFSENDSIKFLQEIVYISESSLARVIKVALFQYLLAKKIRENDVDIVISGEGSDEIFFGYDRFYEGNFKEKTEKLFKNFFEKIFFYTLLQRLDRAFSYFTIEARVPFLDQELITYTEKLDFNEKIFNNIDKYILRKYAEKLGIPKEIVYRKKEKMTKGITAKENNYKKNLNGYLENICYTNFGKTLEEKTLEIYKKFFYINGKNIHSNFDSFFKEEENI